MIFCVCHAFASVHRCLVVTYWERADLLALVCNVKCIFVTFPRGILAQVWYLIVSIPNLCRLSYFDYRLIEMAAICGSHLGAAAQTIRFYKETAIRPESSQLKKCLFSGYTFFSVS